MIEFKEATINILWKDPNTHETINLSKAGKIAINTGLGYWISEKEVPDDDEPTSYALTHIPSGMRIGDEPFYAESAAQEMIKEMSSLINWDRPMEELTKDPHYPTVTTKMIPIYHKHWLQGIASHPNREEILEAIW